MSIRENLTSTIRGMVEIKQAESDRNIERTIAVVGVGIGVASTTASLIANFIEKITTIPTTKTIEIPGKPTVTQPLPINATTNFFLAFVISLAFGVSFAYLALWWIKVRSRRPPQQ